tara:strand:+ start:5219 stop:5473 length:255 start_codon:yes stop_codon:yes gene_type:complete
MNSNLKPIEIYGTTWCGDCHRSKDFLDKHQISYVWINIEEDDEAREKAVALNDGVQRVPVLVFPDNSILVEPTNSDLEVKLGLN